MTEASEPTAANPTLVANDPVQLRWSFERLQHLVDSYLASQQQLERKAYGSAAALAVVIAVGIGMCPNISGCWGASALVLICLSALATTFCLWQTWLVTRTQDFNPENLWAEDVKEYETTTALRVANRACLDAAKQHLAAAQSKAGFAVATQVAAAVGILATILVVVVARLAALGR